MTPPTRGPAHAVPIVDWGAAFTGFTRDQEHLTERVDDHETRIRQVEKGQARMLGIIAGVTGTMSVIGTAAGLGIAALAGWLK